MKDGGPAFPISNNDVITAVIKNGNHPEGMSLRDYFAAKAMQGMLSGGSNTLIINNKKMDLEKAAYLVADAMLEAREK